ncbi:MAG: hypothetical protein IT300_18215 [Dehalococcoidia bacterium]|nr:hypothetical protein [Dehalococcoidia bacterium]
MITNDDTIYETEGILPDRRRYQAELWQLGPSYHMTIFTPQTDGESADDVAQKIEAALIQFCGTQYRRVEPVFRASDPFWSYNVVVCDDHDQFVSHLPIISRTESFSVWYGDRRVELLTPRPRHQ